MCICINIFHLGFLFIPNSNFDSVEDRGENPSNFCLCDKLNPINL